MLTAMVIETEGCFRVIGCQLMGVKDLSGKCFNGTEGTADCCVVQSVTLVPIFWSSMYWLVALLASNNSVCRGNSWDHRRPFNQRRMSLRQNWTVLLFCILPRERVFADS